MNTDRISIHNKATATTAQRNNAETLLNIAKQQTKDNAGKCTEQRYKPAFKQEDASD